MQISTTKLTFITTCDWLYTTLLRGTSGGSMGGAVGAIAPPLTGVNMQIAAP